MSDPMQPTYYVQHPDGSHSVADQQPVLLTKESPLVMLCSKCFGWGHIAGARCVHCGGVGHYAEEPSLPLSDAKEGSGESVGAETPTDLQRLLEDLQRRVDGVEGVLVHIHRDELRRLMAAALGVPGAEGQP